MGVVKFGTDGWRGIIADDFTFENVRVAARAIALYVLKAEDASKGVCIGWDTRFGSQAFAKVVAEVLAGAGIPVALADRVTPTPALSYRGAGAKGGGRRDDYFQPQPGAVERGEVQGELWGVGQAVDYCGDRGVSGRVAAERGFGSGNRGGGFRTGVRGGHPIVCGSAGDQGVRLPFLIDVMYGAGAGVIAGIFTKAGVPFVEMRAENNPAFPGINPEPILPHIRETQVRVVEEKCVAGLVTDGDADRIGAVDEFGNVVDAHKIFAILLKWLLERKGWPGDVTRAFNTTLMLDRIAAKYGRRLHEHGIGFKYVCDLMLTENILIGGEESGGVGISRHLPERDGLLNSLLLAQVMADEKKTLAELGGGAAGGVWRASVWPDRHAYR